MKRSRHVLAVLLAAWSVLALGLTLQEGEPPAPHEAYGAKAEIVLKDVPYVPDKPRNKKLMLDIYSNPHQGLWPTVVMIHGGAWFKGDKTMDNKVFISKFLAAHGYVVFSINYRLWPEARMKKQAEDAMAAVIWVKEHAKEYAADPERVAVVGGSAGGHLAALVAWASDDPWFKPTGYNGSLDSDVLAAGLYYPVMDVGLTLKENTKVLAPLVRALLIGPHPEKKLRHLSPMFHVDENCVPTIFLTGDADSLHLYPQSVEYAQKLKSLEVPARLFTAEGKDHGFTWNYWDQETLESVEALVSFLDEYLKN